LQEEFPRNYYDLYTIDVENNAVKKLWELPNPKEPFTNSNSLVIDKNNGKFYALAYPNKRYASFIMLHEYSLDKPHYRVAGDSISYIFNDIESYCDLFQSSDSSELYTIITYIRGNTTDVQLYTMAYPPLSLHETIQQPPLPSKKRFFWLLLLFPACVIVVSVVLYRKKQHQPFAAQTDSDKPALGKEEEPVVYKNFFNEKRPSSIYLLGNFQVIDSDSVDITKNFTPTTNQLFLLLLMSTVKNGQGITSNELKRTLWADKDDDSARNNRNVYINKLRSLLKTFRDIKVMNQENYWSIQYGKDVFCDYERIQVLMKMLHKADRFSIKLLNELVDIALRGTLLPYIQEIEWLEPYQSDFGNLLIERLIEYSKREEEKKDLLLLLKIADLIFLYDNIEEDAIKLKCYALYRLGRKNQALNAFNKFTADYESLLAAKHNLVFGDLVREL
jgi:DNA-binding SARP family transcriptional activator